MHMASILMMLKPAGIPLEERLLNIFGDLGEFTDRIEWNPAPMDKIHNLYAVHKGKPYYETNCMLFEGKTVITYLFELRDNTNEDPVAPVRFRIGSTNPAKSRPCTFRYIVWDEIYKKNPFLGDMSELAKTGRGMDNGIHCSDSLESGKIEAKIFYKR